MSTRTPAHGSERYLGFTNAQGLCFRMQVEDDPRRLRIHRPRHPPCKATGSPTRANPPFRSTRCSPPSRRASATLHYS